MRSFLRLVWVCGVALTFLSRDIFAQNLPWQYWTAPNVLARLDPSDMVLEHSSHCYGGCRYDRDGFSAPTPLANNPYPNRGLYSSAGEVTVFDDLGAGAIARFWLTTGDGISRCIDPAIIAKIYLDGASTPTLSLPLAALFDGSTAPFQPPLELLRSYMRRVCASPSAMCKACRIRAFPHRVAIRIISTCCGINSSITVCHRAR